MLFLEGFVTGSEDPDSIPLVMKLDLGEICFNQLAIFISLTSTELFPLFIIHFLTILKLFILQVNLHLFLSQLSSTVKMTLDLNQKLWLEASWSLVACLGFPWAQLPS